ncbi:bactericidal permeability-increasing protein-like isoform X2 [Motacilla alba alba]|uniref:bactericidal permeability-increasing protein-like isoform X2 n=1 Tax=Motacilla alba alba TaxID=1094192 RepID=UPI0018D5040F|nr:bactericidal permeability-increasing protein-like isoform X2 [Motacilla alba alba]
MAGAAAPAARGTAPPWRASRSQDQPRGAVWLCFLLLLPTCVSATTTNPGIKVWLTQRTLEFGRRFGLELLQSMLQKEHELNLTGSYNTPLLGTLTYAVPRIHIRELQMNESTLGFAEDVGLRLTVQRARIQLSADWAARLGAIQDSGSVELRMQDLAVAAVLGVSEDGSGHPTVWSAGCDTHGTDLRMEFHRGYSWLYNLLAPLLQRTLRQQLNKQLCLVLHRGIDRLDAALKHMKVSTQLDTIAAIDHSLLGPPAFTEEYGDLALKGEIFRVGTYQQRPSALPVALPLALPVALPTPLPTPPPMAHEPTLLLAVTELVASSAAFTYFTAGALRRNISSDVLPRRFPLQLRTKSMEVFSPQLQERYPDQPMELHLWARQQPLLSCHPDALHGTLFSSAEAFVVLPNATRVPAFLLNIVSGCCCHGSGSQGTPKDLAGAGVPVLLAGASWLALGDTGAMLGGAGGYWGHAGWCWGILGPCWVMLGHTGAMLGDAGLQALPWSLQCLFLLQDANVTGMPTITRNRLGGTVRLTGLHVTQVASNVGPVEVKRLETLLKFGLWLFGVPRANSKCCPRPVPILPQLHQGRPLLWLCLPTEWLQAGIPLPLPRGLSLLRPRLSLHQVGASTLPLPRGPPCPSYPLSHPDSLQGFVLIATDLRYEP